MIKAILNHPMRVTGRLIWLAAELGLFAAGYLVMVTLKPGGPTQTSRSRWLRWTCRRGLRIFNVTLQTVGVAPSEGLIVSNHLGYIDVLVLASLAPTTFVAKHEVARWPVFGWYARKAGTLFVNRGKRTDAARSAQEIEEVLGAGALITLFPEGTSSGGETVLPFKSALLAPAARGNHPITVSCIQYSIEDGNAADDVCYWGDMTLVPHLINLLAKREVSAHLAFQPVTTRVSDRKELARQLHAEVLALRIRSPLPKRTGDSVSPSVSPVSPTARPAPNPI
jgi:1-acyl-sn-glycerol-3-phosphate acyltransferase